MVAGGISTKPTGHERSVAGDAIVIRPLRTMPIVQAGMDLAALIVRALYEEGIAIEDGDVIILAQKIVSKAEGRAVSLSTVIPSDTAETLAARVNKDPRIVELILRETDHVMRERAGTLIVRHRLGLVLANAGIDQSNIDHAGGEEALLLPIDPDASCRALHAALTYDSGHRIGVMIIDSLGRAWRSGTTGTAIGLAGMPGLLDLRGQLDLHGRALQSTELGWADEIAAAASLAMGQGGEGRPVVLVRGLDWPPGEGCARDLVRPIQLDLFP